MRILILSFYFTPDLSAGSFRAAALVRELQDQLPAGSHIDVLTTMPNRYHSFSAPALEVEEEPGLSVRRIRLPQHRSGILDQSKAFLVYARAVRANTHTCTYDLVFATSSRLMTAVLGASIARSRKVPLYLDIRDIFVDTIQDVLPRWLAWPMCRLFVLFERYATSTAAKVNLVSEGFKGYFVERYPDQRFSFFTNGIDDEFLVTPDVDNGEDATPPYSILYAGNIGEGQGLHFILPGLARALQSQVRFRIIGDGGRKEQLKCALSVAGIDNVVLLEPVNRDTLMKEYRAADVLFLHLNDHEAFRKVLPSKLFEYAATGKPILAGATGYAAGFINQEIANAQVFRPCDADNAVQAFARLQMGSVHRKNFIDKYARRVIMQAMAKDVLSVAKGQGI